MEWEYQVVVLDETIHDGDEEEIIGILNREGKEGWELVSVVAQSDSCANANHQVESVGTICNVCYFKRKRS